MQYLIRLSVLSLAVTTGCSTYVSGTPGDDDGGPDAGPGVCTAGTSRIETEPVGPTVQLLVDQSGSMHARLGDSTRWEAMRRALVDPQSGLVPALDDRIYFGLTLYHGLSRQGASGCVTAETLAPSLGAFDGLAAMMNMAQPSGDTPTASTLTQVASDLAPAAPGSRRIILLATDGFPDNCQDPDQHDLYSRQLAEDAVEAAYATGIETLVLGIGEDNPERHLQRMANAGIGLPLSVGAAPYYVAREPVELEAALEALIGSALPTCSFRLDRTLTLEQAAAGSLALNGEALEHGVDWRLVSDDTLELLGDACDTALASPSPQLSGEFPCD